MMIHHSRTGRPCAVVVVIILFLIGAFSSCSAVRADSAAEKTKEMGCTESIPDIFNRVSPSVVFITTTSINPYQPFDRVTHSVASGVIVDSSGLILTNSHVAFDRQTITVTLDDGVSLAAQSVGADPIFDLALLRIPLSSSGKLPAAVIGDSDRVRVGDEVLAIGNPLGLDQTLTRGIVSAINRILPETPFSLLEPLIQTDAAINPGNSGGPLLNRCGEVIGITTAMMTEAQNIGFAIPINLVKTVQSSLLTQGHVIRPWLGFHGQLVDESLRELLRIPLVGGLLVEVIEPGSPAKQAGIRGGEMEVMINGRSFLLGGDIITSMNGVRMVSSETLISGMRALKVGMKVRLSVYRDGQSREVEYVLPERPVLPGDVVGHGAFAPASGRTDRPALPKDSSPAER